MDRISADNKSCYNTIRNKDKELEKAMEREEWTKKVAMQNKVRLSLTTIQQCAALPMHLSSAQLALSPLCQCISSAPNPLSHRSPNASLQRPTLSLTALPMHLSSVHPSQGIRKMNTRCMAQL